MRIQRMEDEDEEENTPKRHELPLFKIAPFRSGKETHEYFFKRGFTKETAKKFMIGWDAVRNRVTIPVFWQDGVLCGIIGRAVLEEKKNGNHNPSYMKVYNGENSPKYYIYENFPVGDIVFPLPHFELVNHTVILVEGQFDAMWLHQLGYPNALSTLGAKLSPKQVELLHYLGVKKVVLMKDNDKTGMESCERDYKLLKGEFIVYGVTYPERKKDPQMLTAQEVGDMLNEKYPYGVGTKRVARID